MNLTRRQLFALPVPILLAAKSVQITVQVSDTCPVGHTMYPNILGNVRLIQFNPNGNPAMYDEAHTQKVMRSCSTCGVHYER